MSCAECNESKYLFEDLQSMLKVVRELEAVPSAESDRYDFILDECEGTFHRYVGHRVRTIHQNAVLGVEIKAMGYNEGYCIVDYMNKWLPHKSMATTSDAFGQAGESIHGATVYTRALPEDVKALIAAGQVDDVQSYLGSLTPDPDGDVCVRHILLGSCNDHKQDSVHAIIVLEATLKVVAQVEPHLSQMRLRFDNAPGYHSTWF
ncbi:hypothetical protein CYMTET_12965 [Cymbomonas tetramitiformis]|uniref:Uncharacterized protein n=1 Tax=Cymbomonas tetramitiformis TaxID=36881 RepID=A0AAE0LBB8_9CHLO|nr:hypothetical protein CYMTET_12965 [Cymbomonas tetramitiformis]